MGVVICLPLFGTPDRELEDHPLLEGRHLRKLATELNERLQRAADTLDRLTESGWSSRLAMYDVLLSQPGVETRAEAEKRLRLLGIAPEALLIIEEVDEETDEPAS
jgi:hypothetical protein